MQEKDAIHVEVKRYKIIYIYIYMPIYFKKRGGFKEKCSNHIENDDPPPPPKDFNYYYNNPRRIFLSSIFPVVLILLVLIIIGIIVGIIVSQRGRLY